MFSVEMLAIACTVRVSCLIERCSNQLSAHPSLHTTGQGRGGRSGRGAGGGRG